MNLASNMHLPKEEIPLQSDLLDIDLGTFLSENVATGNVTEPGLSTCPECHVQGRESQLAFYQINFNEAISMCPHPLCSYPMKEKNIVESFVIKRDASNLQNHTQKMKKPKKKHLDSCEEFFKDFDVDSLFYSPASLDGAGSQTPEALMDSDVQASPSDPKVGLEVEKTEPEPATDLGNKENSLLKAENNGKTSEIPSMDTSQDKEMLVENLDQTIGNNSENIEDMESDAKSVDLPPIITDDDKDSEDIETAKNTEQTKELSDIEVNTSISTEVDTADDTLPDIELPNDSVFKTPVKMPFENPGIVDDPVRIDEDAPYEDSVEKILDSLPLPPVNKEIVQWSNESNSCWLDTILMCLVNSVNLRGILNMKKNNPQCVLRRVCLVYDKCQENYQKHCNNIDKNSNTMLERLAKVRSDVVENLGKKLPIQMGGFQSPLEIFPMVLKMCPEVEKHFKIHTLWHFQCDSCGHERARRSVMHVVSFPYTSQDFHPLNASFERPCFSCQKNNGVMEIWMEKLPPCLIFHFQNGLPHSNFKVFDFGLQGALYSVIAVVQYVIDPVKHFIAWIRNPKTNRWLCCNDLNGPVCRWQQRQPRIPPGQVHMVFWERQSVQDPLNADQSCFSTIMNNEASSIADEIPVELFYAHENDETIVLSEDKTTRDTHTTKPVDHSMQIKSTDTSVAHIGNGVVNNNEQIQDMSLVQPQIMNEINHNPGTVVFPQNSYMSPNVLANNAISVIPATNGTQTIQVVAPSNTCNIVIVMSDNKNQQILYNSQQATPHNPPPTQSFLRERRFHSNKRHSVSGEFTSFKPKRHFKLSGYAENKSLIKKFKFSPLRVTTKKKSAQKEEGTAQAKPGIKSDSEKGSEVSEMSDNLPDFDVRSHSSGDSHNSAPAALKHSIISPPSLQNGRTTSPTANLSGLNGSYTQTGMNSNVIFSQNPSQTSVGRENDEASEELFFLNTFFP